MSTWIKSITVLALVLTLGLHWALLQTVAWTGMVINYSQANPFPEAVSMTFDGEHPCRLCKVIKQGRTEEQRQERMVSTTKLPIAVIWQAPRFCFAVERPLLTLLDWTYSTRAEAPPKPRPKVFSPALPA